MKNIRTVWLVIICFIFLFNTGCATQDSLPNIVFILADDLGYSQVGCYGSRYYQTPHLDNMAKEGLRFINAYAAAPVCSATRASIMTGKYPARLNLTDYIPGKDDQEGSPLIQPEWQKFLPLEEVTIAELLQEKGYKTAMFGKWHLSVEKIPPGSLPFNPDKQGFDESFITYKPSGNLIQPWQTAENDAHNVDTITSLAIDFIDRNKSNPFFLFVSHNTIHNPLKERSAAIEKYKNLDGVNKPENNPIIGAMVERLDNSCGEIFDKLSELGLDENTIVVFYSDHGGLDSEASQTPLKKGKGWLYEGGIRVPLIIKWKQKIDGSITSDALISSIDFLPTFSELGNLKKLPQNIDGESFVSILKNPSNEVHKQLFWHYPHYHEGPPSGAIRSGKWKLIEWYDKSLLGDLKHGYELYNLEDDIGEMNNLSDSMKAKTKELAYELKEWKKDVNAQMMVLNPKYIDEK